MKDVIRASGGAAAGTIVRRENELNFASNYFRKSLLSAVWSAKIAKVDFRLKVSLSPLWMGILWKSY